MNKLKTLGGVAVLGCLGAGFIALRAQSSKDLTEYKMRIGAPGPEWRRERTLLMEYRYHNLGDDCTISAAASSSATGTNFDPQESNQEAYDQLEKGGRSLGLKLVKSYPERLVSGAKFQIQQRQSDKQIVLTAMARRGNTLAMVIYRAQGSQAVAQRRFDKNFSAFEKTLASLTLTPVP